MQKPDLYFFNQFKCELFEAQHSTSMPLYHYHDAYEIFFLVDGARGMDFNGVQLPLQRGDIFIAQPFVPHRSVRYESGYYKRYTLNFSRDDLKDLFTEEEIKSVTNHLATGVYHVTAQQAANIEGYLERIRAYHSRLSDLGQKMAVMEIFLALDYINSLLQNDRYLPESNRIDASGIPAAVFTAMNYVKEHYSEDIHLDLIAEHVHLSKSQFCRVFQTTTGTSFMQYLNSYRLTQAHTMISHTDKPLHSIAESTGFYSTEHMTRTFQKTYKMSPSQWRRTYQKSAPS